MKEFFQQCLALFLLGISFQSIAQKNKSATIDTSVRCYYDVKIQGKKYTALLKESGFSLLNSQKDTIFKLPGDYFTLKFEDFNKDGFKDIWLDEGTNKPEVYDLLLYVPSRKKFRKIKNFDEFPDPKPLKGAKFYYSYHKNGCADMDWVSDLFYIDNYRTIRIGEIDGVGCGNETVKSAIYIYKFKKGRSKLLKTFPFNKVVQYKESKWGFIKQYWTETYKEFSPLQIK